MNITALRTPAGYLEVWPRSCNQVYQEQLQIAVRAGLECGTSRFQVQRPNHSATLTKWKWYWYGNSFNLYGGFRQLANIHCDSIFILQENNTECRTGWSPIYSARMLFEKWRTLQHKSKRFNPWYNLYY